MLNPLLVNSLPRSGTTILMHYLSQHPQIVAHQKYPYETRYAIWVWHSFNVMRKRQRGKDKEHHWSFLDHEDHAERNPWFSIASDQIEYFRGGARESFFEAAKAVTNDFYAQLAEQQGKDNPKYFSEKFPGSAKAILRRGYDVYREVFILRDPRDVFLSSISFNKKRNRKDFRADGFENEEGYLAEIIKLTLKRLRPAKKTKIL